MAKSNDCLTKIWFYTSITFLMFYSLYILSKGKLSRYIPNSIYSILLITSYTSTLYKYIYDGNITRDANFYNLLLLFTIPHPLFLFAHFVSAIYNVSGYIASKKRKHGGRFYYKIAEKIIHYQRNIMKIAYTSQLLMIPLIFLGMIFGIANLFNLFCYFNVVKYEFNNNQIMRDCLKNLIIMFDDNMIYMPTDLQQRYNYLKTIVKRRLNISTPVKQKKTE